MTRARHFRSARRPDHIDLGSNAEILEIQPGFNGEPASGQQPALVVRFIIIEMRAIAVNIFAEAVAGAMQDGVLVPGVDQHLSRRAVGFEAAHFSTGSRGALHHIDCGIARAAFDRARSGP